MVIEPVEIDLVSMEEPFLVILRSNLLARMENYTDARRRLFGPTLLATVEAAHRYTSVDFVPRTVCAHGLLPSRAETFRES